MAVTISGEMSVKQKVRANLFGGANSFTGNPTPIVNAATTASGLWRFAFAATATQTATISGTVATNVIVSGNTTAAGLVAAITSVIPTGIYVQTNANPASFLKNTTTDILLSSGVQLVVSGTNATTATLTNVYISSADFATAYPEYSATVGIQDVTPNWTADATVHTNLIYGFGTVVASGSTANQTFQTQVRQIQTGNGPDGSLETQVWDGYFAVYSGSLNQSGQKITRNQQC